MRLQLPPPSGRMCHAVLPVFIPFAGCPHRCIFCAQDRQTGRQPASIKNILDDLEKTLAERQKQGLKPVELAFYGGTFTAIPKEEQSLCLKTAAKWRERGVVCAVRCSTRPDAVDASRLSTLREWGMDLVELGVQSFSDQALDAAQRGYAGEKAREGCRLVLDAGLKLGIQLLPGMPGGTPEAFLEDVEQALRLGPSCMRMYPCLVLEGTRLSALWREGRYTPWTLEACVRVLGRALALAWEKNVPVIRLSLAPEPALERAVLAGPRHPSLGSMIQGEALWLRLEPLLRECPAKSLRLPRHCSGFFAGFRGSLLPRWKELGIDRAAVTWIDGNTACWDE